MVQKILPEARFQVVQYPIQEIDGSAKGVHAPDSRFLFEDGLFDLPDTHAGLTHFKAKGATQIHLALQWAWGHRNHVLEDNHAAFELPKMQEVLANASELSIPVWRRNPFCFCCTSFVNAMIKRLQDTGVPAGSAARHLEIRMHFRLKFVPRQLERRCSRHK